MTELIVLTIDEEATAIVRPFEENNLLVVRNTSPRVLEVSS